MKVGIIGAGVAGAACASVLNRHGIEFAVFEKSRGAGGRLTTRRISGSAEIGDLSYDHGCPSFEWPDDIQKRVNSFLQSQTVQKFGDFFVSCPSMPQIVKDLLGAARINTQIEIESIAGTAGEWFFIKKANPVDGSTVERIGPFTQVVVTAPAPQATKLLAGVSFAWASELLKIHYSPCWSLMFSVRSDLRPAQEDHCLTFENVILQNLKPARATPSNTSSWVAQASAEWSIAHLEHSADDVVKLLLPQALGMTGYEPSAVIHSAAHRWRYSQVVTSLAKSCLVDEQSGIYYAGDGCLGRGVAGAIESGLAVGHRIIG